MAYLYLGLRQVFVLLHVVCLRISYRFSTASQEFLYLLPTSQQAIQLLDNLPSQCLFLGHRLVTQLLWQKTAGKIEGFFTKTE